MQYSNFLLSFTQVLLCLQLFVEEKRSPCICWHFSYLLNYKLVQRVKVYLDLRRKITWRAMSISDANTKTEENSSFKRHFFLYYLISQAPPWFVWHQGQHLQCIPLILLTPHLSSPGSESDFHGLRRGLEKSEDKDIQAVLIRKPLEKQTKIYMLYICTHIMHIYTCTHTH